MQEFQHWWQACEIRRCGLGPPSSARKPRVAMRHLMHSIAVQLLPTLSATYRMCKFVRLEMPGRGLACSLCCAASKRLLSATLSRQARKRKGSYVAQNGQGLDRCGY